MFKKNKDILNIALPAMGENFLQMLMGMVDSYLVAHLGLIAISGVSVAGNIITIYQAIFIALGAAISSVISKSLGEKNQSKLAYHVTEALKITLLVSFLLGALSIFAGQEMIGLLGPPYLVLRVCAINSANASKSANSRAARFSPKAVKIRLLNSCMFCTNGVAYFLPCSVSDNKRSRLSCSLS